MTRGQAQRECNRLNAARNVTEHHTFAANADNFWVQCSTDGNRVITGGDDQQRIDMLMSMLRDHRSNSADPVIVLTGSAEMEAAVIRDAKEQLLGKVSVSSARFRNYDPLRDMDPSQMKQLLVSVAQHKGYNSLDLLEHYIEGFLAVCSRSGRLSLSALVKTDRKYPTNKALFDCAEALRIAPDLRESIRNYPLGTQNLRSILRDLSSCYSGICDPDAPHAVGLSESVRAGRLLCIRTNSKLPQILDLALAAELQALYSNGQRYLLVLHDVPLISADGIYQQLTLDRNVSSRVRVAVCTANVCAWADTVQGISNAYDTLVKNIKTLALFYDANEADGNLDRLLHDQGTYLRFEVAMGGGHGAILLPILSHSNWNVVAVGMHDRVRPEDMNGFGVLLKGHDGRQIHLYRNITL